MIRIPHVHSTQICLERMLVITILLIAYFGHILHWPHRVISQLLKIPACVEWKVRSRNDPILRDKILGHFVLVMWLKMNRKPVLGSHISLQLWSRMKHPSYMPTLSWCSLFFCLKVRHTFMLRCPLYNFTKNRVPFFHFKTKHSLINFSSLFIK